MLVPILLAEGAAKHIPLGGLCVLGRLCSAFLLSFFVILSLMVEAVGRINGFQLREAHEIFIVNFWSVM